MSVMSSPLLPPDIGTGTTTLYATLMHNLRSDVDKYMFCVDKVCYTLEQANDRVELLGKCNTSVYHYEDKVTGTDLMTGGNWLTYSRPGAQRVRLFIEVKRIVMLGSACTRTPILTPILGPITTREGRYLSEISKDKAGHVWLCYIHDPSTTITMAPDGKPENMPWRVESVHSASGNALARAKRIWKEDMLPTLGKSEKVQMHYGFAKWIFLPFEATLRLVGNKKKAEYETLTQIRVERIYVTTPFEQISTYIPAHIWHPDRPYTPLRHDDTEDVITNRLESTALDLGYTEESDEDEVAYTFPERQRRIDTQRAPPPKFRNNLAQEYGELARAFRGSPAEPATPVVDERRDSVMDSRKRWSLGVVDVGRSLYHVMMKETSGLLIDENGSPAKVLKKVRTDRTRQEHRMFGAKSIPPPVPSKITRRFSLSGRKIKVE